MLTTFIGVAQTTADVDRLCNEAEALLNSNPKQGLKISQQANALAEKLNYKKGIGKTLALRGVANYKFDIYDKASLRIKEAIEYSSKNNDTATLSFATYWRGNINLHMGNYSKALDDFQTAYVLADAIQDKKMLARSIDGKASIYESLNQLDKAEELYKEALKTAEDAGFKDWPPTVIFSLGNLAYNKGKTDEAIKYYNEAITLSEEVYNLNNKANCMQQLASIYYEKNESKKAMKYIQQAMDIFQQTGSQSSFSYSRLLMSAILLKDKQWNDAIALAEKSLQEGRQKKETALQRDAAEMLYYSYLGKRDNANALKYHVMFHDLAETNHHEELSKKITQLELQDNFKKQREVENAQQAKVEAVLNMGIEKQRIIKKTYMIGFGLLIIIAGLAIFAFLQKRNDTRLIAAEKTKSDKLLLNILPADIVTQIKQTGLAQNIEPVTALFADLKSLNTDVGLGGGGGNKDMYQQYIIALNDIANRYQLEPIKTTDDSYLCVSEPGTGKPEMVVKAALDMLNLIEIQKEVRLAKGEKYYEISIGIHSGVLVGGIIGVRKANYDIWGDTIDVAGRMEQHSETGKINVSDATYELVKHLYKGTHHGKITGRSNEDIEMYFIDAQRG
jgi:class 3 adenylate cyclase/Tfp pilus assembly protein PilF